MSDRSNKTILFPQRTAAADPPGEPVAEEPVYEVDDVLVESDGTVHTEAKAAEPPAADKPADAARRVAHKRTTSNVGAQGSSLSGSGTMGGDDPFSSTRAERMAARRQAAAASHGGAGHGGAEHRSARRGLSAERSTEGRATTGRPALGTAPEPAAAQEADAPAKKKGFSLPSFSLPAFSLPKRDPDKPSRWSDPLFRRRFLIVAACVVAALAFLYGPVRDLYRAKRDNAVYTAQKEALEKVNAETLDRVQSLSTEEGIKDEAHLHGYVEPGETAVTVEGLPDQAEEGEALPIPDDVRQQVLDQPDPWYVELGDVIFGYKKGA